MEPETNSIGAPECRPVGDDWRFRIESVAKVERKRCGM
jgi:hypothetical protein